MTIQIIFIEEAEYLLVEVSGGVWTTQEIKEVILSISERAKERGYKRILVDRRNLSNPKTELSRFEGAQTIAKLFPYPFRFAVVYPHEKITRFGEDVAVNRLATAKAFTDIGEAKQWLLEDPSV